MVLVQTWIDEWPKLSQTGVEGEETHMAGKNLKSSGKSRLVMNRLVVFTESVSAELIAGAFPQLEPLVVGSKSECANALVPRPSSSR